MIYGLLSNVSSGFLSTLSILCNFRCVPSTVDRAKGVTRFITTTYSQDQHGDMQVDFFDVEMVDRHILSISKSIFEHNNLYMPASIDKHFLYSNIQPILQVISLQCTFFELKTITYSPRKPNLSCGMSIQLSYIGSIPFECNLNKIVY